MQCSKNLSIEAQAALSPLAWWTMDLGIPTSETDSVNGLALTPIAGGGFMTTQAGKVLNSYQHVSSVGQSVVSVCTSPFLALSGTQGNVSVVCWVNVIAINNPFILNNTGFAFNYDQGASTFSINCQLKNDGFWHLRYEFAGGLSIASGVGWQLVVFTYDGDTNLLGVSINNSALSTFLVGTPAPGANTSGTIIIGTDANDAWTVRFDELSIWDSVLTADQIDYLWNSGNGRTYPP